MPRSTILRLGWTTVNANSNGSPGTFWPDTPWMTTSQVGGVRPTMEMRALNGDQEVTMAYQTANVENTPIATDTIGSAVTANGFSFGSAFIDISTDLDQAQLVRFGWMVRNTTTSNITWSRVGGSIEILDKC